MIVLSSEFSFYSYINLFYNSILLTERQLAKPMAKIKIVIKLESSILFVNPRFEYSNNLSLITIESQVF